MSASEILKLVGVKGPSFKYYKEESVEKGDGFVLTLRL
jgi:hypothetical protein